jgi:hypothetical protein
MYMLRSRSLPVPVALLLMASSRLHGRVPALLTLGRRGPGVAVATSGLDAQHSQHSTCDGSYPPLARLLRCTSVRPRSLGATSVLVRHVFLGVSSVESVGVNWWMGSMSLSSPLPREIYPRSPALLFRCHKPPPIHTNSVNMTGPQCDRPLGQGQVGSGQGY